jgi:GT2 family glycosyltransferase
LKPKVHIILVHWNSWSETATCLSSLQSLRYENRKVILVDNGSTDDSVSRIREEFPWVEVVLAGKNLGFPGGCNIGMRQALAEVSNYVWLLNNDATVDPGALDALVNKAEADPHVGAVGSAIYCMEKPTQLQAWGGGYVNFWIGRARHFLTPVPDEKIQYLTGASLLIPARVLNTVGFLDDGLFLYWDDPDYCWRVRAAGWKLAVAGDSKVWHKGASAWGRSARLDTFYSASAVRFFNRHSPIPFLSIWIGVFFRIAKRLIRGDWDRALAIWFGAMQGRSSSRLQTTQPASCLEARDIEG